MGLAQIDINEKWEELDKKIKSIIKNIPEVIIKFSKQREQLKNQFGTVIGYLIKEKKKIKL